MSGEYRDPESGLWVAEWTHSDGTVKRVAGDAQEAAIARRAEARDDLVNLLDAHAVHGADPRKVLEARTAETSQLSAARMEAASGSTTSAGWAHRHR